MGKRYYCDYCDKSFADNPVNRKLHLSGNIHLRNRKAHYDSMRDERGILEDDLLKKPCRSFMTTGDCRFGERCQYSHLTSEDKTRLSNKIIKRQKMTDKKEKERKKTLTDLSTCLDKWLEERSKTKIEEEGTRNAQPKSRQVHIPEYQVAECLSVFSPLPPSLIPPTKEDILNADYADWG